MKKAIAEQPADEQGRLRADALLECLGVSDGLGFEALMEALEPGSDIEMRAKGMATGVQSKRSADDDAPVLLVPLDDVVKRLKAFVEAESASVQVSSVQRCLPTASAQTSWPSGVDGEALLCGR